ncbi:hypothetical protein EDD21DRAFT_393004 [Dissophora ornata]|nr:hypothetical protein EDD21DRAFT_393004 [Dissophora ornata]
MMFKTITTFAVVASLIVFAQADTAAPQAQTQAAATDPSVQSADVGDNDKWGWGWGRGHYGWRHHNCYGWDCPWYGNRGYWY